MRLLAILTVALGATGWFAPMIVATSSLKQQIPKILFPKYPGTIELGNASLGWLQPVVVQDLNADDAEGNPFLNVKEFSTSLPLWRLAINPSNLGRLILVEPKISVDFRTDGSNVEDIIQKMMAGPANSSPAVGFELDVRNATLNLDYKLASLSTTIEPVSLILQSTRGSVDEMELTMGNVPSSDDASLQPATDWLAFHFGNQPTQDGVAMTPGSKHIRLKATAWSLQRLQPVLARFEPGAELSGAIDADARSQVNVAETPASWTDRSWSWDGRITLRGFVLAGMNALKKDRVALETTSLAGRLAADKGRLAMDGAQLQTEVGQITATGDIPLAGLASASPINAARSILGEQDYTIQGHVDLQKLAALLPNTMRIRAGTEITGGQIEIAMKSEAKDGAPRSWTAAATLDHLTARNQGQPVAWNEPLKLLLQAHQVKDSAEVDMLSIQSDFFKLAGKGSLGDAQFSATGDLTKLEENLQRFVDVGIEQMAGAIKAQGHIRRGDDGHLDIATIVQLDNFRWDISKGTVWQEPRLVLSINAAADTDADSNLKAIDSAELKMSSGQDSLVSTLQQPVNLTATASWPINAKLAGDLRTWQNRLRPFVSLQGWQLAGATGIETTVTADTRQVEIHQLTANFTNLDAHAPDWWIKEPQAKLETTGIWTTAKSEWSSPVTTLTTTAIACRINDLLVDLKSTGQLERITGDAAFRGDLDKLSRWKNQALERPSYHAIGAIEGRAHLVENNSTITVELDTTITKLVFADLELMPNQQLHWVALWREPELHLKAKGGYDTSADQMQLDTASIQADGLALDLHGTVAQLSSAQSIDLAGNLDYDWQALSQRMGDSLKQKIQLSGKQQRPFAIKGTLASLSAPAVPGQQGYPVDLTGSAGIGWDSAVIEGLAVSATDISAKLDRGVCQFNPIVTTVAGGNLHLTPQVRLDTTPAVLVLPAERVIDQVQITPQLSNSWLKFVAPLLADATQIDGKFSLDIGGGTLPLSAPTSGEMGGTLGIHHVQVKPGGAALQVTGMIDQIKSLIQRRPAGGAPGGRAIMQMPEQNIPFKLTRGRVYHEGVIFLIGDGKVISSGSVGMDESVDLALQIPILPEWAQDQKLLAGLSGKTLKIPVRGSLGQPQFDARVLSELAAQIGGTALEGALENKLDDLFKSKLNKFLPKQN